MPTIIFEKDLEYIQIKSKRNELEFINSQLQNAINIYKIKEFLITIRRGIY